MLGAGDTFGINGCFSGPGKNLNITFSKAMTKVCLSLHYNADGTYFFVNRKEMLKFKAHNGKANFPTPFCLGSISNGFRATESREVSLGGNMYYSSSDYISVDKPFILYIHKHLMIKNNIK